METRDSRDFFRGCASTRTQPMSLLVFSARIDFSIALYRWISSSKSLREGGMSAPVSAKQRQSQLNLSAAIEGALSNPVSGDRGGFTPSCLVVFSESQTERDSFISFFQRSSYTVNSAANVAQRSPFCRTASCTQPELLQVKGIHNKEQISPSSNPMHNEGGCL